MWVFSVATNNSVPGWLSQSGTTFDLENTSWQEYVPFLLTNLAYIATNAILLLASVASVVFMSRFTASSETTALSNLRLPSSCIISKCETHTDLKLSAITSSPLRPLLTSVCKSIFIAVVIGVISPITSKILATFEAQFCLISLDAMMLWCCTGFFPRCFLTKFNLPILLDLPYGTISFQLHWHCHPSSVDRELGGSPPMNVTLLEWNRHDSTPVLAHLLFVKLFQIFLTLTNSHLHKFHLEQFD